MEQAQHLISRTVLEKLVPLNSLSAENLDDLARKMSVERIPARGTLFSIGDRDNRSVYLLSGEIELRHDREDSQLICAGDEQARHPLAHRQPRPATATAVTEVEVMRIDNRLLDMMMTWDQAAGYVVSEISVDQPQADQSDWMSRMLQSSIFFQVPPANIQELFKRMQPSHYSAGTRVIRQGEAGTYYYVISQGQVAITRKGPGGREVRLAVLQSGDHFGEEALISDAPRNASATMLTDGVLMRLAKSDFDELLKGPVLEEVDLDTGRQRVAEGAVWLDVRVEAEHQNHAIEHSLNIPLFLLRLRARELDPDIHYIVYCDTGQRSAAAAYLLSEAGFNVAVLAGGYRDSA